MSEKVLFFDHSQEMGGAEYSLLDIMSEIRGIDPVFVSPSDKVISKFKSRGIRCIHFPMPRGVLMRRREKLFSLSDIYNLPSLIMRFFNLLRKEGARLIYTNTQKAHFVGAIAGKLARIPCISHFRDILPKSITAKIWLIVLYLLSTHIIAISKAVANEFPKGKKVKVIYNGIKIRDSRLTTHDSRLTTVGYVGQIARWKGIEYFIKAAPLIIKEVPDVKFLVVGGPIFGDVEYLRQLKEIAQSSGLNSKIQFTGEKENISSYMAKLDVLVCPSVQAEPFGRILIEAGAMGKPVVAMQEGAIPEVVEDGVTGILVPAKDPKSIAKAVNKLIVNPQLAKSMGERGKERVTKYFNLDRMIKELEEVMREVLI